MKWCVYAPSAENGLIQMMAFLSKGKKIDLITLASELKVQIISDDKVLELRDKIVNSEAFKDNIDFVQGIFENIVEEGKTLEEEKRLAEEREFELQKLRLEAGTSDVVANTCNPLETSSIRVNLKKVLPDFNPEKDDMN